MGLVLLCCSCRAPSHQYPAAQRQPLFRCPRYLRCLGVLHTYGTPRPQQPTSLQTPPNHGLPCPASPRSPGCVLNLRPSSFAPLAADPLKDSSSHFPPSFLANGCEAERPAAGRAARAEKKGSKRPFPSGRPPRIFIRYSIPLHYSIFCFLHPSIALLYLIFPLCPSFLLPQPASQPCLQTEVDKHLNHSGARVVLDRCQVHAPGAPYLASCLLSPALWPSTQSRSPVRAPTRW